MRNAKIQRKTAETNIEIELNLDGSGKYQIDTGIPFFDHMLNLFSKHGLFDINIKCEGDIEVDYHHTVEDTGIALGQAFLAALGDKAGIRRYSSKIIPMDEALVLAAIDISGRPFLAYDVNFAAMYTGNFDAQLAEEFLRAFAVAAGITMHVKMLAGVNTHHILECIFKCLAVALDEAVQIDVRKGGAVPSTKGVL